MLYTTSIYPTYFTSEYSRRLDAAQRREVEYADAAASFAAVERQLRGALARASDTLLEAERQKTEVASSCATALRDMKLQLQHETMVHFPCCLKFVCVLNVIA